MLITIVTKYELKLEHLHLNLHFSWVKRTPKKYHGKNRYQSLVSRIFDLEKKETTRRENGFQKQRISSINV